MTTTAEMMNNHIMETPDNIGVTRVVDNQIRLICRECLETTHINMSKHPHLVNKHVIKYKCKCGHVGKTRLEKRAQHRKPVSLNGELVKDGITYGFASIKDLSKSGLKFESHSRNNFNVGDDLELVFRLDDKKCSLIRQRGIIRHHNDEQYGLEFIKGKFRKYDRRLEFYFF